MVSTTHDFLEIVKTLPQEGVGVGVSIYRSAKEQRIYNVPIIKPLLIFVLSGTKNIGQDGFSCQAGSFAFLSNDPAIDIRNIPGGDEYVAVLIEFEYSDFDVFDKSATRRKKYFKGEIDPLLGKLLQQYLEWSVAAPSMSMTFRKKEILQLIYSLGYKEVASIAQPPSIRHQVHELICRNLSTDVGAEELAAQLHMSESTLRRRLREEGASIQEIKSKARLASGLHLVQTTMDSIGRISELCGFQSQSRFAGQFKSLFGVSPSELRKTRLSDTPRKKKN